MNRFKSGGSVVTSQKQWAAVNGNGNWYFPSSATSTSYDEDTRWQMEGLDTPNFHSRKKRGELLPYTPYKNFRTSGGNSAGAMWYRHKTSNSGGGWCEPGNPIPNTWTMTDAKFCTYSQAQSLVNNQVENLLDQAASAIYSKNSMDGLTFAAELTKTLQLFAQFPKRLIEFLKPGMRGGLPITWLEYRYGWRILWYDIQSFLRAHKRIGDLRTRFTERVGYNDVQPPSIVSTNINDLNILFGRYDITTQVTYSRRGTITVDTEGINPFQAQPLVTAWELIPYSFIIDWVIGIGDYLSAASAQLAITGYAGASSVKARITKTIKVTTTSINSSYNGEYWQYGDSVSEIIVRVPAVFKLHPSINIDLDSQKLIDLIFLLKNQKAKLQRR